MKVDAKRTRHSGSLQDVPHFKRIAAWECALVQSCWRLGDRPIVENKNDARFHFVPTGAPNIGAVTVCRVQMIGTP